MKLNYSKAIEWVLLVVLIVLISFSVIEYFKAYSKIESVLFDIRLLKGERFYLSQNIEKLSGPEIDCDLLDTQSRNVLACEDNSEHVFYWKEFGGKNLNVYCC